MVRFFLSGAFVFLFSLITQAQEVKVRAGFFADSVGIGEETKFYLTAAYPSKLTVLFPDSTFNFSPFEYEDKKYFATQTTNGVSYDSVIYLLSTFEIEKVQTLSLPVYAITKRDSVAFTSNRDTVMLAELVSNVPDSISAAQLPLRMNTTYKNVNFLFNYPILVIVVGGLVVIALIVFFVFGKRIRRYFRIKKLTKEHSKFLTAYSALLETMKESFSSSVAESTLLTWKRYMEQLETRPYTKLTTREIIVLEKDDALKTTLHMIDKAIYGHPSPILEPLEALRGVASEKFFKKLEKVKHG